MALQNQALAANKKFLGRYIDGAGVVHEGWYTIEEMLAFHSEKAVGIPVNAVAAYESFTITASAPTDTETVTIGGVVYTFKDSLTGTPGAGVIWVLNDGVANTATNLYNAINGGTGSGTVYKYGAGAAAHTLVTATNPSSGVVTVTAKTKGVAGNLIAIAETATTGSWGSAAVFLSHGVNGTVGTLGQEMLDTANNKLWKCKAANTIADANWVYTSLT